MTIDEDLKIILISPLYKCIEIEIKIKIKK